MMKYLSAYLVVIICLSFSASGMGKLSNVAPAIIVQDKGFYSSLTELLQKYVQHGQVDYKALQKEKPALDRLVHQIGRYPLSKATTAERKAFLINAYNVLVLHQVLEHYPLSSVMDVPGFFDKKKYKVAGEVLTLNELEKEKLLKPFKDARLHLALVCGAKSCPPLLNKAYTPENVEEQLQAQVTTALNNPQFIRIKDQTNEVEVSEIFKWYEEDFLEESPSIKNYINRYRKKPISQNFKVEYYSYDWKLNDTTK